MERKHVFLTEEQVKQLVVIANGKPLGEIIRRAIDQFLKREGKKR